jgi:hypothetical protein
MATRVRLTVLSVAVVALAAACSSGSDTRSTPGTDQSVPAATDEVPPTDVDTTDVPTSQDPAEGSPVTFGAGTIQLVDPALGLENAPPARATLTATFDGTRDGAAEQWSLSETSLTSNEPLLAQFSSERTGTGAHAVQHLAVGGVEYDIDAAGTCAATVTVTDAPVDEFAPRHHPVEMLFGFVGGAEAGTETIGAVETVHYTFDGSALGLVAPATADGNVWVSATGGYIVRYSLVIDGTSPYLGQSVTGRYTLDYELHPLDAPPVVAVPAICPAGFVGVAPPADATDVVERLGLQVYSTASTITDLQAWYDSQLPAAGWAAVTAPLIAGTTALLTYERPGERLSVSISQDPTATVVTVVTARIG